MKILVLSRDAERLRPILSDDELFITNKVFTVDFLHENDIDIGISHGYRHILKQDVLDVCPFVNLHIAYLPWNKGADPNIWSWIDATPKGVTIHYIDAGIDTGDIIAQREVAMKPTETLQTSYDRLQDEMVKLFAETWPDIRSGNAPRSAQNRGLGSLHYVRDRVRYEHLVTDGFETLAESLALFSLAKT